MWEQNEGGSIIQMRTLLVATLSLIAAVLPQPAAEQARPAIYIGSVVGGVNNDRFRTLLRAELERSGLLVTDVRENSDAVLSGSASAWSESVASFSAVLAGRNGEQLWAGTVPRPLKLRKTHCDDRDTTTTLAQNLARAVRKVKIPVHTDE